MSKNQRLVVNVFVNSIFLLSVWYGVLGGNTGLANLAYFLAWMTAIVYPLSYFSDSYKTMNFRSRSIPKHIGTLFNVSVVLMFAYAGAFATAAAYAIGSACEFNILEYLDNPQEDGASIKS